MYLLMSHSQVKILGRTPFYALAENCLHIPAKLTTRNHVFYEHQVWREYVGIFLQGRKMALRPKFCCLSCSKLVLLRSHFFQRQSISIDF